MVSIELEQFYNINTIPGEYIYKPWAFDTILIYLYVCVILVSVNISE